MVAKKMRMPRRAKYDDALTMKGEARLKRRALTKEELDQLFAMRKYENNTSIIAHNASVRFGFPLTQNWVERVFNREIYKWYTPGVEVVDRMPKRKNTMLSTEQTKILEMIFVTSNILTLEGVKEDWESFGKQLPEFKVQYFYSFAKKYNCTYLASHKAKLSAEMTEMVKILQDGNVSAGLIKKALAAHGISMSFIELSRIKGEG